MNRFIIVDGLPYLYADGAAYKVRWDDKGFTVGGRARVKPSPDCKVCNELSVKAKCSILDSIGKKEEPAKLEK